MADDAIAAATEQPTRRREDAGMLCWLAARLSQFWDFVDKRQIDMHVMAWAVFWVTVYLVVWVTEFVRLHPDKPGLEVGAIIAAIMVPWTPLQAKVIDWYFRGRQ